VIKDLLKLNVNDHTEKKGNLTYLSWAWAWDLALKADEQATYKVEMFGDKCYMDINGTAMVFVTVTIFGKPMTCQLPVMDYKNKAITNPDAFAINTAIMRCMTKALSLHGLGLYIYSGEDLPEDPGGPKIRATDGALVDDKQKSMMHDVATSIRDHYAQNDIIGAVEEILTVTDVEEKTYLWSLLDSKIRSAITKQIKESK
jgi:Protein of unknown function (DUF1071)